MFGGGNLYESENPQKGLVVDFDVCAEAAVVGDGVGGVVGFCPAEDPVGFAVAHVDAAVTHFLSEVFVPVCAVECVADGCEES